MSGCRFGCVQGKVFLSLSLRVGTGAGRQQRVVTFSQASGTFIAVAIINSVPTETESFGWAGQYLSLRVWSVAHTLLLSSYSSLTLSASLLPCHLMYLRSVMLSQFKQTCVSSEIISNWATVSVKIYSDSYRTAINDGFWFFLSNLFVQNPFAMI